MPAPNELAVLAIACLLAAALYSCVGHGGASAYLAAMGFAGIAPVMMKPTALVLNIFVSALAVWFFGKAGHWRGKLFWPLALASIPAAFLGGWLQVSDPIFKTILAGALLFAAWQLAFLKKPVDVEPRSLPPWGAALLGCGLGFLSGLVGIGGGVFLTPLLILFRWADTKTAAAISAAFILVNSISGLLGFSVRGGEVPSLAYWLLPGVMIGGVIGAFWGSRKAPPILLRLCLALVLATAAVKFAVI
jgi:uncharacterized membrane protein YfcA